jgi:hypothetical protein
MLKFALLITAISQFASFAGDWSASLYSYRLG